MKSLLAIGGHDPSGHAGVLADQEIWQKYQIKYQVVLSAVTAQSKNRFLSWEAVSPNLFKEQLESVSNIWGIKIGMIATPRHAEILANWLKTKRGVYTIWDPVWKSSTGAVLLKSKKFSRSLKKLVQQCHGFTPNLIEAKWILNKKDEPKKNEYQDILESLYQMGSKKNYWVLLKGGHSSNKQYSNDWLYQGKNFQEFTAKRLKTSPRGTGCRLAASILAELYLKRSLTQSINNAKKNILALF